MKIRDIITDWIIMPQTIKPQGLIHKKGYGPNNRFGFKNVGNNKANEAVQYKAPKLDYEWKEAQRYPALAKLGLEGWKKLQGKRVNVRQLGGLQKIGNHTAPDQNTANKNLPNLEQGKVKRTQAMVKSGVVELPIVVKLPNGKMDLLGGNTRFTSLVAMGIDPDVWYIDDSGLKENFADGKVKGKSRPGRVKKSGASCNGTVTSLRKKAKNASGEKAKMYHWCANMKSGRKKG